jgi:hypothetical protein
MRALRSRRSAVAFGEISRLAGVGKRSDVIGELAPAQVVSTGASHPLVPPVIAPSSLARGPMRRGWRRPSPRSAAKGVTCTASIPSIRPPSRTPGASTRRRHLGGSRDRQRPRSARQPPGRAAPPVRSSAAWSHKAWCATAQPCSSSDAMPGDVRARIRVRVSGQRVRIGWASVVVAEGTLTI